MAPVKHSSAPTDLFGFVADKRFHLSSKRPRRPSTVMSLPGTAMSTDSVRLCLSEHVVMSEVVWWDQLCSVECCTREHCCKVCHNRHCQYDQDMKIKIAFSRI